MGCGAWLAASAAFRAQRAPRGIPRDGGLGGRARNGVPAPRLLARLRRAALEPLLAVRLPRVGALGRAGRLASPVAAHPLGGLLRRRRAEPAPARADASVGRSDRRRARVLL